MADEYPSSMPDRDVVRDEVWYDRRPLWSRLLQGLPLRQLKLVLSIVAALVLLGLFTYIVLSLRRPTPIITVGTQPYQWPFPPQAWVAEDFARISDFQDDNKTLRKSASIAFRQNKSTLAGIDQLPVGSLGDGRPIIFYVGMHGAERDGVPYLVPPGASPFDANQWMPIKNLLDSIRSQLGEDQGGGNGKIPVRKSKLLVLDCSRVPVNWYLGWLSNDFSGTVKKWWDTNGPNYPDFAILTSAGPGERSWTSADLHGSVFAYYLQRGLAGDAHSDGWRNEVSLEELEKYVRREVDAWVQINRADHQRPMLLRGSEGFPVLTDFSSDELQSRIGATSESSAPLSVITDERNALWKTLKELRADELYRFEPLAWRDLEHMLLSLDQLAESGSAYARLARQTYFDAASKLSDIQQKVDNVRGNRSIYAHTDLIADGGIGGPAELKLRSLPLAQYFGTLPHNVLASARDQLSGFQKSPGRQQLAILRRNLERAGLNDFVEAQYAQMLQRYQFPDLWANSAQLARLLDLRPPVADVGVPASDGGFVGDERVHYQVRRFAEAADMARRDAEDALFVDGQPNLEAHLQAAEESAKAATQFMARLQDAMRVRDRAWAELAYHLQWQADPLREKAANQQDLQEAILLTKVLEQKLFNSEPSQPGGIGEVDRINVLLDAFTKQLADECITLQSGDGDASTLRGIEAALANPLLTAEDREDLHARYGRVSKRVRGTSKEVTILSSVYEKQSNLSPIMLLGDESRAAQTADGSAAWRQQDASLRAGIAEAQSKKSPSRQVWIDLERQLRAMAPICCVGPNLNSETDFELPVRKLREIDLRALLLWHAQRALNDFWGPADDEAPYFAQAASDYLESVKSLDREIAGMSDGEIADSDDIASIRETVNAAGNASRHWLSTQATNAVLIDPREPVVTRVGVTQLPGAPADATGTAAVFLRDDGRRIGNASFRESPSVAIPLQSEPNEAEIPDAEPLTKSVVDAMTMFRGHEFAGQFAIEPLSGAVVELEPHEFKPGGVALRSPANPLSVVLVLDCSQSMEQPLDGEKSRLTVAKEGLGELLARLGSREDVRVGVRFFGHRVGWSTDRPVRVLTSPTYPGEIPPDLTPDRDVERVLSPGALDFTAAQQVFAALNGIEQGWGQSPLYYALSQTLRDDFAGEAANANKHVIVITDGRNYQARPAAGERTSLYEVIQASQASRTPVHILALAPDALDDPDAASQFGQLASQSGGTYQVLSTSLDLRETLRALVQPDLYQLDDADGRVVDEAELGVRLSDAAQRSSANYSVRYEDAREVLRLDGGEAIDLYLRPNDRQLYAFPYSHDVAAEGVLTLGGQPLDVVQRVHRTMRRGDAADFYISLQRLAPVSGGGGRLWRWTPRPHGAWIEITPLSSADQPIEAAFPFYDVNYEPDQPVPLLRLSAANWPADATQASISAWYQATAVAPDEMIPLTTRVRDLPGGRMRIDANFVDNAQRLYRVRVIERHFARPVAEWLMISPPIAGELRPDRITRRFDQNHGLAVHTFDYANPSQRELEQLRAAQIGIAGRARILSGAMRAETATVAVSDTGELLPLNAGPAEPAPPSAQNASVAPR